VRLHIALDDDLVAALDERGAGWAAANVADLPMPEVPLEQRPSS